MRDDELIEQLRAGLRRMEENPQELWDKLIRAGIIDAEGNVLVQMPEPPSSANKTKKKKKTEPRSDGNKS